MIAGHSVRPLRAWSACKRRQFQNYESPELLLGVGEGAILYAPLSFLKPHRCPRLRHFKGIAADVDVGLDQSLVVRPPSTGVRVGSVVIPCRKSFWGVVK